MSEENQRESKPNAKLAFRTDGLFKSRDETWMYHINAQLKNVNQVIVN